MKNLFLLILAVLVVFSQVVSFRYKAKNGWADKPVYWSTVMNPTYKGYLDRYFDWRKKNNLPENRIVIDVNSFGIQKTVVQSVAGVASDIIDTHAEIAYYREMEIIENLDAWPEIVSAVRSNLEAFPAVRDIYFKGGHLAGVPTRIHTSVLVVNEDALARVGMKNLPFTPTLDQYESFARDFVRLANAGKDHRDSFFSPFIPYATLFHASGISLFNETGTALADFDEKRKELMIRYLRWIYDDHFIPSAAEMSSFTGDYNGLSVSFSLFYKGQLATMWGARYIAIFMRQMAKPVRMGAMLPPNGGYPVTDIGYGGLTLYKGSKNKEKALGFMRWCTSPEFARAVVDSADAIPPFSGVFDDPALNRPARWTNEWDFHPRFVEVIRGNHVAAPDDCPYLIGTSGEGAYRKHFDAWIIRTSDAGTAWSNASSVVTSEVALNLKRHPEWQERYERGVKNQKEIDRLKRAGSKIPLALVENPYLKQYYRDTGLGVDSSP